MILKAGTDRNCFCSKTGKPLTKFHTAKELCQNGKWVMANGEWEMENLKGEMGNKKWELFYINLP